MAKLIGISRDPNKPGTLSRGQLPISIEDSMRVMVAEFEDPRSRKSPGRSAQSAPLSLKSFCQKLSSLDPEELYFALSVDYDQFSSFLSQLVPCVGCKRCVEKLFLDLASSGHPAIDPLIINDSFVLTVDRPLLGDYKRLYQTLFGDYGKVRSLLENLTKCRKNKRCHLHSLDAHTCKMKYGWTWDELFDVMAEDCKAEACIIECESLQAMLDTYLEKHRFCPECKNKLQKAYSCLIGEIDGSKEKGYNAQLFRGIKYCEQESHIHLNSCTKFLNSLIERAEMELSGSSRDRHAKTLEVGQMEVLTCIGLFMHSRLYKINTALKTLHLSYELLHCTAYVSIYASFQHVMESKEGLCESFEKLCQELQETEQAPRNLPPNSKAKSKRKRRTNKLGSNNKETVTPCSEPLQPRAWLNSSFGDSGTSDPSSPIASRDTPRHKQDQGYSSSREGSPGNNSSLESSLNSGFTKGCKSCSSIASRGTTHPKSSLLHLSTLDEDVVDENSHISEKEIEWFKRNENTVLEQRKALRAKIWNDFQQLQARINDGV